MQEINIKELFATDVRSFSIYDCQRSIPSGVDGFKPSMRKIVFGMRKKFASEEVKVSIAAAAVQSVSCFHHGSLEGTMVKMAQSFIGSNNVPFLQDIGQFGSRISPDASATRYIFTKLTEAYDKIFNKEDEHILEYLEDDGQSIEPKYYLPIIPTVLINGSDGMGTGFACRILNYNPRDLIDATKKLLNNKSHAPLIPWYRGYTGDITKNGAQVVFTGKFTRLSTSQIKITELPIGQYTSRYRDVLNDLEDKGLVKTYDDNSTESVTEFIVTCSREVLRQTDEELLKAFKLVGRETENFTVWVECDKLCKFDSADDLLKWFVTFRLTKYEERRLNIIHRLQQELSLLRNRSMFIRQYLQDTKKFSAMTKDELVNWIIAENLGDPEPLLSIRVYNMTLDQIAALDEKISNTMQQLSNIQSSTATKLYLDDLDVLKQFFAKKFT